MGGVGKIRQCPFIGCNQSFNRPYRLAQHILLHQNIRKFSCLEENCTKEYASKTNLDRHIKSAHQGFSPPDTLYWCPQCQKKFVNRQNLKRHFYTQHVVKKRIYCEICNTDFAKKHLLNTHMYRHTGVKAFTCELCSKSFITQLDKKRHMRFHSKTYSCDYCFQTFNHWSKYTLHRKTEHAGFGVYICDYCQKQFKSRTDIVRHMKIHTTQCVRVFQCTYENCNREYTRKNNLQQHIRAKHKKVTHDCTVCQAKLSTKATLQKHLLIHVKVEGPPRVYKTNATGRKERKDKGTIRGSTALKIAGLEKPLLNENCVTDYIEVEIKG